MKIKLLISRSGVDFSQARGDIVDVDTAEGLRMIEAGQAEVVRVEKAECAVKTNTGEKAVR